MKGNTTLAQFWPDGGKRIGVSIVESNGDFGLIQLAEWCEWHIEFCGNCLQGFHMTQKVSARHGVNVVDVAIYSVAHSVIHEYALAGNWRSRKHAQAVTDNSCYLPLRGKHQHTLILRAFTQ